MISTRTSNEITDELTEMIKESNGIKFMKLLQKNILRKISRSCVRECVELLNSREGCDLNFVNKEGCTPLMMVCERKETGLCLKMLNFPTECGFDIKDNSAESIFKTCCANIMGDVCMKLLEPQFKLINAHNYYDILNATIKDSSIKTVKGSSMETVCEKILDDYDYIVTLTDKQISGYLLKTRRCEKIMYKILKRATQFRIQNFCAICITITATATTLLMFVCDLKMTTVALELLKNPHNCFLSSTGYANNTALQLASYNKMEEVCAKILQYPDDCAISNINKHGKSAFTIARENNMNNISTMIFNLLPYDEKQKISDAFISDPIYGLIGAFNKSSISNNMEITYEGDEGDERNKGNEYKYEMGGYINNYYSDDSEDEKEHCKRKRRNH